MRVTFVKRDLVATRHSPKTHNVRHPPFDAPASDTVSGADSDTFRGTPELRPRRSSASRVRSSGSGCLVEIGAKYVLSSSQFHNWPGASGTSVDAPLVSLIGSSSTTSSTTLSTETASTTAVSSTLGTGGLLRFDGFSAANLHGARFFTSVFFTSVGLGRLRDHARSTCARSVLSTRRLSTPLHFTLRRTSRSTVLAC